MNESKENRVGETAEQASNLGHERAREGSVARPATEEDISAFNRFVDYDVVDKDDSKIGTLNCLWVDNSGQPAFLGIKTGWLFGKTHVVPAEAAEVNEGARRIRLPFTEEMIKGAPAYDNDRDLDLDAEREIHNYYHLGGSSHEETTPRFSTSEMQTPTTEPRFGESRREESAAKPRTGPEEASIQLSEEELRVGKRQVEVGGVRLRKVIRTETVNQPVELAHEEIVVERVPAGAAKPGERAFSEQEVYIPLRREEAVVQKEARVREEVRARKQTDVERQNVSGTVRREDVEVEREGEAKRQDEDRRRSP